MPTLTSHHTYRHATRAAYIRQAHTPPNLLIFSSSSLFPSSSSCRHRCWCCVSSHSIHSGDYWRRQSHTYTYNTPSRLPSVFNTRQMRAVHILLRIIIIINIITSDTATTHLNMATGKFLDCMLMENIHDFTCSGPCVSEWIRTMNRPICPLLDEQRSTDDHLPGHRCHSTHTAFDSRSFQPINICCVYCWLLSNVQK